MKLLPSQSICRRETLYRISPLGVGSISFVPVVEWASASSHLPGRKGRCTRVSHFGGAGTCWIASVSPFVLIFRLCCGDLSLCRRVAFFVYIFSCYSVITAMHSPPIDSLIPAVFALELNRQPVCKCTLECTTKGFGSIYYYQDDPTPKDTKQPVVSRGRSCYPTYVVEYARPLSRANSSTHFCIPWTLSCVHSTRKRSYSGHSRVSTVRSRQGVTRR